MFLGGCFKLAAKDFHTEKFLLAATAKLAATAELVATGNVMKIIRMLIAAGWIFPSRD